MTFSYLNTFLYYCQVCHIAATSTVLHCTDTGSGTSLLSGDKNADQKCLKFWHLIC